MPATGAFSGTPASISASEAPQTVAIDDEPLDSGDLRDDAERVGELVVLGQQRTHRAPGELAVADFAAAGRAHAAGLTDRVGREVVVQQEALLAGAFQAVDILLVLAGAERGNHEGLRLAAGEQRRAVRARQHVHFRHDRAHGLEVAAVDALLVFRTSPRMMSISSALKASPSRTFSLGSSGILISEKTRLLGLRRRDRCACPFPSWRRRCVSVSAAMALT